MRIIDADALHDAMRDEEFQTFVPLDEIDSVIDKAPTIDAEPVKHGRWIRGENWSVACSVCGCLAIAHDGKNYCPNCGAKMDLKEGNAHEKSDSP